MNGESECTRAGQVCKHLFWQKIFCHEIVSLWFYISTPYTKANHFVNHWSIYPLRHEWHKEIRNWLLHWKYSMKQIARNFHYLKLLFEIFNDYRTDALIIINIIIRDSLISFFCKQSEVIHLRWNENKLLLKIKK